VKLSDTEAAYAAGILDGEGSIYFSRNRASRWPSPIVSVASTDRELLEWLRARLGGSIVQKRTYQPQHALSYDWKLTDRRAGVPEDCATFSGDQAQDSPLRFVAGRVFGLHSAQWSLHQ
jgi:hypothetical protein